MANPADILAGWQKKNLHLWLTTAISTAPSSNNTITFRSYGTPGTWPTPMAELEDLGFVGSGVPSRALADYRLGAVRPAFSIEHPLTADIALILLASCLQNKSVFAGGKYDIGLYSDAQAKWFFGMETGAGAENGIEQVYGCICKSVNISVPMSGPTRGRPMIRGDIVAAYHPALLDAITGTAPAYNAASPLDTTLCTVAGTNIAKYVSLELNIDNGAVESPNAVDPFDAWMLGEAKISGSIQVCLATGDTDEWKQIRTNLAAGSLNALTITLGTSSTNKLVIAASALFRDGGAPQVTNNVLTATFPFDVPYVSAASPLFSVYPSADLITVWT